VKNSSNNYDVVIAGGGPAGTSAAIQLAMAGARVLLAEQKKFPRAKLCGEFISPECIEHFARLGVDQRMVEAGGTELCETVFYSRSGRKVGVPSEWFGGGKGMALGLSRAEMDARLLSRAREAGVRVMEETQAVGLLMKGKHVDGVRLKRNGEELEVGSLAVIDATGRSRSLARRTERASSKSVRRRSAPLVAFKAHLENSGGDPRSCEIYFYLGGYGGLNSIEGGLSNLCFIVSASDVRAHGGDAGLVMRSVVMKNQRAAEALSGARVSSEWLAVALESFGRGILIPASGIMAVGDAASFIDPFTGSGMLMALESGELAAQTITNNLTALRKDGSFDDLAREYRVRYDEIFGTRLRICSWLRRAAFVPRVAESMIFALGGSQRVRRMLARSTRRRTERASVGRSA
jgi:flavin-dependent dehydrogenase